MQRICFVLQVKPDRLEEYKRRHRNVWREMQAALRAKPGPIGRDRDVSGNAAVEKLARQRVEAIRHMTAQRLADVDVLPRNPQWHA